jgi:hypothetical protein
MATATEMVHMDLPQNETFDATEVVAAGQTIQQMRTPYCTAVAIQRSRNLSQVQHRLMQEADLCGEDFFYAWGSGKNHIEGPSKELAFAAARCWGNCAVQALPLQETADSWIFTAAFVDLETGFTMERSFRQSKRWTVYGKMDAERKDDIRFQIGQSKAARNVILNCLPATLINKAMERAKAGVRKQIEDLISKHGLAKAVDVALIALGKVGVKEQQVLAKLGVSEKKAIDIDGIVLLKGDLRAIESGQERAEELYPVAVGVNGDRPPEGKINLGQKPAEKPAAKPDSGTSGAPVEPAAEATPASQPEEQAKPQEPKPAGKPYAKYAADIAAIKSQDALAGIRKELSEDAGLIEDEKMTLLDAAADKESYLEAQAKMAATMAATKKGSKS